MSGDSAPGWGSSRVLTGRVRTVSFGGAEANAGNDPAPVLLSMYGFGDRPADETSRRPEKAVLVYPWEHYAYWAEAMDLRVIAPAFGEHATTEGLLENDVFVGDIFRWGAATVQVSQPWRPTSDIGARLGRSDLPAAMQRTRRTGFYLRVLHSGRVGPDDQLTLDDVDPFGLSVADVTAVMTDGPDTCGVSLSRILLAKHLLPEHWMDTLQARNPAETPPAELTPVPGPAG